MHWYLIALGVGVCVALQPTVKAALRREVGVAPVLILLGQLSIRPAHRPLWLVRRS